jgi:hypothetical protein
MNNQRTANHISLSSQRNQIVRQRELADAIAVDINVAQISDVTISIVWSAVSLVESKNVALNK